MADDKPIIVVKKKGGHGGHHGGAWKIAYADFVTAMMAFFMVMWLVNSASVNTRESIASYFRKPGIFHEGSGTPLLLGGAGILEDAFAPPPPEDKRRKDKSVQISAEKRVSGESDKDLDKRYTEDGNKEPQKGKGPDAVLGLNSDKSNLEEVKRSIEIKRLAEEAKSQLLQKLAATPSLLQLLGKVEYKIEPDGLTIEIMDTDKTSMFQSGSAIIRPEAREAFARVTEVVKAFPNKLEITGHTDGKPFPSRTGGYTNWELSADRANSARRLIETLGFPAKQIGSVVGKSSQELKNTADPLAPGNRRITLKMKIDPNDPSLTAPAEDKKKLDDLFTAPPDGIGTAAPTPPPAPGTTPGAEPPTPTPTVTPTYTPTERPTPRQAADRKGVIRLPDEPVPTANPDFMEKDKIFKDKPVIGPGELFSGT